MPSGAKNTRSPPISCTLSEAIHPMDLVISSRAKVVDTSSTILYKLFLQKTYNSSLKDFI